MWGVFSVGDSFMSDVGEVSGALLVGFFRLSFVGGGVNTFLFLLISMYSVCT